MERLDHYLSLKCVRVAMMVYVLGLTAAGLWVVVI